jgi:hypothetical protein
MNSSAAPQPDRDKPASDGTPAIPSKEVLEDILRQTLAEADVSAGADVSALRLLVDVARRHRGVVRPTAAIVRELVGTLLETRFPPLQASPQFRDTVALEIAATLLDDPYQRDLLHRLWSKLCDKVA